MGSTSSSIPTSTFDQKILTNKSPKKIACNQVDTRFRVPAHAWDRDKKLTWRFGETCSSAGDSLSRIKPSDVYHNIVRLKIQFQDGTGYGTATAIDYEAHSKNLYFLTAAHCVYDSETESEAVAITVQYKKNKPGSGSVCLGEYKVVNWVIYDGYKQNPSSQSGKDIAILQCKSHSPPFKEFAPIGSYWSASDHQYATKTIVCGYPGDKNGDLWLDMGPAQNEKNKEVIENDQIDTWQGQSGGPILQVEHNFVSDPKCLNTLIDIASLWVYILAVTMLQNIEIGER